MTAGTARAAGLGPLAVELGFLTQEELDLVLERGRGEPASALGERLIRERYLTVDGLEELLELERRRRGSASGPSLAPIAGGASLDQLLARGVAAGMQELLLLLGRPPAVRAPAHLVPTTDPPLDAATLEGHIARVFEPAERAAAAGRAVAKSFETPAGRFRAILSGSLAGPSLTVRRLGLRPDAGGAALPEELARLADLRRGLVIVAGARPADRAGVLARLVERVVERSPRHVIVLAREARYEHAHGRGLVAERVVGVHTASYEQALRATLREDPDVLAIGELRGPEAIATALLSAETGHLVLCSLHATTPAQAVRRLVDVQGTGRRGLVRSGLAGCLQALAIVEAVQGRTGRHLVADILPGSPAVSRAIREDQLHQLPAPHTQPSGVTRDARLVELVRAGQLSRCAALQAAADPDGVAAACGEHHGAQHGTTLGVQQEAR